ncbi:MAG: hypothetical protein OES57_07955, partial [Acidimicrobiia bacterium]|nr:hypothetical protein [Acidimicrobiia bacterium]
MVRWTTVVVAVVLAVSGVVVSGAVIAWWRSPGRVEYRADRRALRRAVRRWTRLASSPAGTSTDRQVRRLEHLLDVATQACRARRRNTGLVRYLRDWREPQPEHLDTPFERR